MEELRELWLTRSSKPTKPWRRDSIHCWTEKSVTAQSSTEMLAGDYSIFIPILSNNSCELSISKCGVYKCNKNHLNGYGLLIHKQSVNL